jgi:hypothetical protein
LLFNADLWFPLEKWKSISANLASLDMGRSGNAALFSNISLKALHRGWEDRSCSTSDGLLNSDPKENNEFCCAWIALVMFQS